ncbi:putative glucan 1,3-beta-glucosidase [Helianthus annuus]|nr:putative glucan 1,3-beta-glucosidase [Helianthus annuus]
MIDWLSEKADEYLDNTVDKVNVRIGAATAAEVRATGIPYAFAPCIVVCRDPRWG